MTIDPTRSLRPLLSLLLPCASLIGALGWPAAAGAYVPSITNETETPLRWMRSNCVYLRPNAAGSDDIKDGSDLKAVERSVKNWHDAIKDCSYIRFELLDPSDEATLHFDEHGPNENVVIWVEDRWKHDRQAAGITTVYFIDKKGSSQDGRILDADVEINGEFFHYATTGAKSRTDVENTVTHELGHVLGLDHPCDDGTRNPLPTDHEGNKIPKCFPPLQLPEWMRDVTMYNFADPGETHKRSPEEDDILGICETYPQEDDPGRCAPIDLTETGCVVGSLRDRTPPASLLLVAVLLLLLTASQRRR